MVKGWFDKSDTETASERSDESYSLSGSEVDEQDSSISDEVNEDDPQIRRLKWLKPEYHPNYIAEIKNE